MQKNELLLSIFAAFAGVVALFVILSVLLSISGCVKPRNETMCLKNNVWVQCPYNVRGGADISKD